MEARFQLERALRLRAPASAPQPPPPGAAAGGEGAGGSPCGGASPPPQHHQQQSGGDGEGHAQRQRRSLDSADGVGRRRWRQTLDGSLEYVEHAEALLNAAQQAMAIAAAIRSRRGCKGEATGDGRGVAAPDQAAAEEARGSRGGGEEESRHPSSASAPAAGPSGLHVPFWWTHHDGRAAPHPEKTPPPAKAGGEGAAARGRTSAGARRSEDAAAGGGRAAAPRAGGDPAVAKEEEFAQFALFLEKTPTRILSELSAPAPAALNTALGGWFVSHTIGAVVAAAAARLLHAARPLAQASGLC